MARGPLESGDTARSMDTICYFLQASTQESHDQTSLKILDIWNILPLSADLLICLLHSSPRYLGGIHSHV